MLTLSTVNNVEENSPTKAELTKTIWISMRVISYWGQSISEVVLEYKISRDLKPSYFKTQHLVVEYLEESLKSSISLKAHIF